MRDRGCAATHLACAVHSSQQLCSLHNSSVGQLSHHPCIHVERLLPALLHASFMAPSLVSCIFPQQQQQQVGRTCA